MRRGIALAIGALMTLMVQNVGAQDVPSFGPDAQSLMMNSNNLKPDASPEEVADAFQQAIITQTILRPTFSGTTRFFSSSENEDTGAYGIYDEIMIQEYAKIMAKQDVFHLKQAIKRSLESEQRKKR